MEKAFQLRSSQVPFRAPQPLRFIGIPALRRLNLCHKMVAPVAAAIATQGAAQVRETQVSGGCQGLGC